MPSIASLTPLPPPQNPCPALTQATDLEQKRVTGFIFYIMFAIVTSILLFNLFIAMLADTYTRISTKVRAGGGSARHTWVPVNSLHAHTHTHTHARTDTHTHAWQAVPSAPGGMP